MSMLIKTTHAIPHVAISPRTDTPLSTITPSTITPSTITPSTITPSTITPSTMTLHEGWRAVTEAYQQAVQATTAPLDYDYCIAGFVIRLRFANKALADQLTPALAHLVITTTAPPALLIKLYDSATSGVALPTLPALLQQPLPTQAQWGNYAHSERFHAFWQPSSQIFTMLDQQQHEAIYWVHDAHHLPLVEGGAPLLMLFHWWLGQQRRQVVHSAAVGTAAGGALLVGKSGSGKSTTALACLNAGLRYVGDDYCAVAVAPQPTVYSLYSSGKVHFADLARFPRFQTARSTRDYREADKALFFFAKSFIEQITPSLLLKAIFLPTVSANNQRSKISSVSPATALLALGPSTVFQLIGEKRQTLHHLGQLVRQLPCYRLELGSDLDAIPALITAVLASL